MATATRIRNTADQAGRLRDNRGGPVIVLHYLIDTPNLIEAYQANGLPRKGDNYPVEPGEDPGPAALPCTDIDIRENTLYRGTTGEYVGTCWATVTFGGADASGTAVLRIPQSADEKWSEFELSTTSVTVYGPHFDFAGPFLPINNGEGASRSVGLIRVNVLTTHPLLGGASSPAWSRLLRLTQNQNVNEAPTTLPPFYGTATRLELAVGQVKYLGFAPERVGNFLQVRHSLELADDHLTRWRVLDAQGVPTSEIQTAALYAPASMEGIWD